jgi:hypothetical protein
VPLIKIGVTLLAFYSYGNIPALIDAANIPVSEGAITVAAIFSNLFGILSKPFDFLSSIPLSGW